MTSCAFDYLITIKTPIASSYIRWGGLICKEVTLKKNGKDLFSLTEACFSQPVKTANLALNLVCAELPQCDPVPSLTPPVFPCDIQEGCRIQPGPIWSLRAHQGCCYPAHLAAWVGHPRPNLTPGNGNRAHGKQLWISSRPRLCHNFLNLFSMMCWSFGSYLLLGHKCGFPMRQVEIHLSIAHSFFSLSPGPNGWVKIQTDHKTVLSLLVTAFILWAGPSTPGTLCRTSPYLGSLLMQKRKRKTNWGSQLGFRKKPVFNFVLFPFLSSKLQDDQDQKKKKKIQPFPHLSHEKSCKFQFWSKTFWH